MYPFIYSETGLLINLEPLGSSGLACQWGPGLYLSPPRSSGMQMLAPCLTFYHVLGIQSQVSVLALQTLFDQAIFPSPFHVLSCIYIYICSHRDRLSEHAMLFYLKKRLCLTQTILKPASPLPFPTVSAMSNLFDQSFQLLFSVSREKNCGSFKYSWLADSYHNSANCEIRDQVYPWLLFSLAGAAMPFQLFWQYHIFHRFCIIPCLITYQFNSVGWFALVGSSSVALFRQALAIYFSGHYAKWALWWVKTYTPLPILPHSTFILVSCVESSLYFHMWVCQNY